MTLAARQRSGLSQTAAWVPPGGGPSGCCARGDDSAGADGEQRPRPPAAPRSSTSRWRAGRSGQDDQDAREQEEDRASSFGGR